MLPINWKASKLFQVVENCDPMDAKSVIMLDAKNTGRFPYLTPRAFVTRQSTLTMIKE